jgi:histidinol dehydrogenase
MDINFFVWKQLSPEERQRLLKRSGEDIEQVIPAVREVIEEVQRNGDAALRSLTQRFEGADISELPIPASEEEFAQAERRLSPELRDALAFAVENVKAFHRKQAGDQLSLNEIRPGVLAGERVTAIDSVGLYVPRGRGSFPSMLYMQAVPAAIAGVGEIGVATPPDEHGALDPACLYAASLCGVSKVYRVGGAQALAAFAYGTESVTAVHKLMGPGSVYVAAAKQLLSTEVDVGMPAGPSESMILADGSADPWRVSLDLMIEAEHGSDSAALLVTDDAELGRAVQREVAALAAEAPEPRKQFLKDVFEGYGGVILAETMQEAAEIVNAFAPEHLQIQTEEPYETLSEIRHAGEILIGSHTPFSAANYAAGANAVLPTGGAARTFSATSVRDFVKRSSVVQMSSRGEELLEPHVTALADYEGFFTHAQAFRRRRERDR